MTSVIRLPLALLVLLYQSVVLAFSQIWANKIRGILTALGILIGVAAVSAVIALIAGMKDRVLAGFDSFGGNLLFVEPHWRQGDERKRVTRWDVVFKKSDFDDMLAHCPSVARYTRDAGMGFREVSHGPEMFSGQLQVNAVDPQWHEIERRGASVGRPLTIMDGLRVRRVCLINAKMRDELKLDRNPVGQTVTLNYFDKFTVVGMLESPPFPQAGGMGVPNGVPEIKFSYDYLAAKLSFYPVWYFVIAEAKSREHVEDAKSELEFYLRQKRRIRPGEDDNFEVVSPQRTVETINRVAGLMTVVAGGIVGISLLVGGVGIMNIMLVSVSERTREIGLRKAVGAKPGAILLQFLVEAVMICLLGGALGLAGGQVLTSTVSNWLPSDPSRLAEFDPTDDAPPPPTEATAAIPPMRLPASAVGLAFTFSTGVGVLFGIFPAIKAARLDPIEALRHE